MCHPLYEFRLPEYRGRRPIDEAHARHVAALREKKDKEGSPDGLTQGTGRTGWHPGAVLCDVAAYNRGDRKQEGVNAAFVIDRLRIAAFCGRWKIKELAFFGSVLGDDFGPDSDIDVLVTFAGDAAWTLFDHVAMRDELSNLLARPVDVVNRRALERSPNWIRRRAILAQAEVFHAA